MGIDINKQELFIYSGWEQIYKQELFIYSGWEQIYKQEQFIYSGWEWIYKQERALSSYDESRIVTFFYNFRSFKVQGVP